MNYGSERVSKINLSQVRKMFEVLGHDVVKRKRETYANLDLTGLKPGEYRKLSNKEIAVLYSLIKK